MSWRIPVARGSLLLMEALWVYALVILVISIGNGTEEPSLIGVGLIVGVSYTISRLLQSSDIDLGLLRIWGVIASLLLFYVIVRVDFFDDLRLWDFSWADRAAGDLRGTVSTRAAFGVPLLWLIWMRGVSRGQDPLMFEAVVSSFATGVVIIVVIELLASALDAPAAVGYVAVPYIALGLVAVGLSHAARSEAEHGRSFSSTWLIAVGGAVALMTVIALVFVLIDFQTFRDAIAFVALGIGKGLYYVFYALVWVIATVVEFVINAIVSILGLSPREPEPPPEEQGEPLGEDASSGSFPGWALWIGRFSAGLMILAVALAALWYTFTRFQKRDATLTTKDSTYTEGRLGADLGNFLGNMLGRLRPSFSFGESEPVRRLYYDMLDEASHRNIRRRDAQTPLELAPALDAAFGPPTPTRITTMFDDARYGGITPREVDVKTLREEWERAKREKQHP
ncbi:MAG: DUF4129 domain-containing protein [Dehalococcoidia bacterium]